MKRPNGYILHETARIVVIATGFVRKSENAKTTGMLQVYFIPKQVDPVAALHNGAVRHVCGNCPLSPANKALFPAVEQAGECYVQVFQGPLNVYRAWLRGNYPPLPSLDLFADKVTRFGAWGDPVHLPLPKLRAIALASCGWTGYTHQWRNPLLQGYSSWIMASVDSIPEQFEASKLGWVTFRVAPAGEGKAWALRDESHCPASEEMGHVTDCAHCLRCGGRGGVRVHRHTVIRNHQGMAKLNFRRSQRQQA